MKIEKSALCRISAPPNKSAGDSILTGLMMERFGYSIAKEMFFRVFHDLVKEFQRNETPGKTLKFTVTCEEIDENRS